MANEYIKLDLMKSMTPAMTAASNNLKKTKNRTTTAATSNVIKRKHAIFTSNSKIDPSFSVTVKMMTKLNSKLVEVLIFNHKDLKMSSFN